MRNHNKILALLTLVILALGSCKKDPAPVPCSWYLEQSRYWIYKSDSLYQAIGDSAYQAIKAKEPQRNFVDHYRYLGEKYLGEYEYCIY